MELLKRIRRLANAAPLSESELELQAGDWTDVLIEVVPLGWLPMLYMRAVHNHPNSHMVNAFDILKECRDKKAELERQYARDSEAARDNSPIERCTHKNRHFVQNNEDRGETIAFNFYSDKDELMPCAHCRPGDLSAWKKTQIALYGEIAPNPIKPIDATPKISRTEEVYLSAEEATAIREEYNELVFKLVDDGEARKNLYISFDEGANRFHYTNRSVPLFTADYMRKIIADYKKRVEVKENV